MLHQRPPEITINTRNEDSHLLTSPVIWSSKSEFNKLKTDCITSWETGGRIRLICPAEFVRRMAFRLRRNQS
jgi:hypothetical protein